MREQPVFCGKCHRTLNPDDPAGRWWLVGERDDGFVVVRCPQHITDWAIRSAGLKRSKAVYRWRALAKKKDVQPTTSSWAEPIDWEKMQ